MYHSLFFPGMHFSIQLFCPERTENKKGALKSASRSRKHDQLCSFSANKRSVAAAGPSSGPSYVPI